MYDHYALMSRVLLLKTSSMHIQDKRKDNDTKGWLLLEDDISNKGMTTDIRNTSNKDSYSYNQHLYKHMISFKANDVLYTKRSKEE